jgi:hypothetical protein
MPTVGNSELAIQLNKRRQGKAKRGKARQGKALHGKERQSK